MTEKNAHTADLSRTESKAVTVLIPNNLPIQREMALRMRLARCAAGMTQKQVAAQIGWEKDVVSRLECLKRSSISVLDLQRFARATGQPVTTLMVEDGLPPFSSVSHSC